MLSYTVPEPRKSQENSRVRKPPQQPRAKVHALQLYDQIKCLYKKKLALQKRDRPRRPSPSTPLRSVRLKGRTLQFCHLLGCQYVQEVAARGFPEIFPATYRCAAPSPHVSKAVSFNFREHPSVDCFYTSFPHERRRHTPRTDGNMTRPNRERRSVAPSREAEMRRSKPRSGERVLLPGLQPTQSQTAIPTFPK